MASVLTAARLVFVACLISFVLVTRASATQPKPHVCIIGAGISGASTAHFLTSHHPTPAVTVFEKRPIVGGRIATLQLPDTPPIEAGASIIAADNALMAHFVQILNLTRFEKEGSSLGLWDGTSFRFRSHDSKARTVMRLARRYGLSVARSRKFISTMLNSFAALYPKDGVGQPWQPYQTVNQLFRRAPEFLPLTKRSFLDVVREKFSTAYVEEMVAAITRVNYGQDPINMNGLSGSVAMAGAGGGLWAVREGNAQVVARLLRQTGARIILNTTIDAVDDAESGYTLTSNDHSWHCDAVVMAAPVELSTVSLPRSISQRLDVDRKFQLTATTFVRGLLNEDTFGEKPPDGILTTMDVNDVFTSIGKVADGPAPVFKVFSRAILDDAAIDRIFQKGAKLLAVYPWYAYPKFNSPERFADFDVDDGSGRAFIYTSPLESAGSAMEMSALSGANAAALVRSKLGLQISSGYTSPKEDL